jgi:carboxymethylenebutenolidase
MLMKSAWKMVAGIVTLALLTAALASRGNAAKTENVQIPVGTETIAGFLATPDKPGRYPALVVIHEWWGLTEWVKEQAQKLADQGYISLAVDLYRGKVTSDPEEAHELMRGLPQDRAVSDVKAAFLYLANRKDVDRDHIGTIGWCMGGGLALQLAIHEPHLAACVVNYGALPTDPNDLQQILAPILGNFGAEDRGITPTDVSQFQKTMEGLKRRVDIKVYEGAGHAFENPTNTAGYRPEAAADAWARTLAFLNRTMK